MRERLHNLSRGVAIYGAGDAGVQIVNFALLAVYVKGDFLLRDDYGALAVIVGLEAFGKLLTRLGLDGAFMRFYHDREADGGLERLTSTIVWALLAAGAILVAGALLASGPIGSRVFEGNANHVDALRFMLVNLFLSSTTFVPFHLMRIREQAVPYSVLMLARNAATLVLRVVLIIGLGQGLRGMFLADLIVTLALLPVLWRWMRPLLRPVFSAADLRAALRFGLPRLPHGLAVQALDLGNRLLLSRYIPLDRVGVYQNGVTLAAAIKFFMAAGETAWAPFYYATARQPDAKDVFRKMTTYGIAALVLLAALSTAVAADVVTIMLTPAYADAARVIPLIAVGLVCQGVFLLTSIGLNLTGRTEYYPVASIAAAVLGLGSGVWLMPRYGIFGAAIAFVVAYVVLAALGLVLAQRVYPIAYETGRIARVVMAGVVAAAVGAWAVPELPALAGLPARAVATAGTYFGLLWITGFLRASERAFLTEVRRRYRR